MFLPYKDDNPTEIYPYMTIALVAANVAVFIAQLLFSDRFLVPSIDYALVPKYLFDMKAPSPLPHPFFTLISSMFMHGSFSHIIGNMIFLSIFGNNIEDTLGHFKFLLFYIFCGLTADLAHAATNADSLIPSLGASGAISGVLGAYLLLYPKANIRSLFFIFFPFYYKEVHMPAYYYIGIWFILQLLYVFLGLPGVAWFAHIGGFMAGAFTIFFAALIWPLKNDIEVPVRKKKYKVYSARRTYR